MLYSFLHNSSCDAVVASNEKPVLVFLHGLLGSGEDWDSCLPYLADYSCLTIDLPGHGKSVAISSSDLSDCCQMLEDTLRQRLSEQTPIVLVGYSMGARIAMHGMVNQFFDGLNLQGVILEGGNFGLLDVFEKQTRLKHDQGWANRFKSEPIEQVLSDWYQQPVFTSLNDEQRQTLVTKRSANLGFAVGNMLVATSLGTQAYLLNDLKNSDISIHYVVGEKDVKFSQIAINSALSFSQVEGAGHNAHQEQPNTFSQIVRAQLERERL